MLDFPSWKRWLTVIAIVVIGIFSIPSMLPESVRANAPSWIPMPTINLGLDLAGGSYILLEAKTEDVGKQRLETTRQSVVTAARLSPAVQIGEVSVRDGHVSFAVRDAQQVDAMRQRLLNQGIGGTGVGLTGQQEWNVEVRDTTLFVITPSDAGLKQAVERAMQDATEVVRRRIDELGTREPTIVRQGSNRIVVQVPGLKDPSQLKALLGKTARLEFKLVDLTADPTALIANSPPIGSTIAPYPSAPGGLPYAAYPPNSAPLIALKRSAIVTGDQLLDARQGFDQNQRPSVDFRFDSAGGKRFARTTQENLNKPFAIVVDGSVISAPNIQSPILNGSGQITGGFTVDGANQLAIALRSGKLPVTLQVVEESTISPELGNESVQKGGIAAAIATLLVIALMLFTYLRFGVYAVAALIVNIIMILGIMAIMNATLTLPGIAGFVLTIGAAVDANVLINERIREEQRRGRSVIQSVEIGYKEASRAIIDANLTNVIAAAIMFIFGSGPVRGFAVVLTIGILTSMFTAVTFTRLLAAQWLKSRPKELVI